MRNLTNIIIGLTLVTLLFSAVSVSAQAIIPKPKSLSGLSTEQQKSLIELGGNKTGGGYGTQVVIPFIAKYALGLTGTISFIALVYGGFLYVSTFGDETQTGNAKKIIMWALIGLVIAMFAYAIVSVVLKIKIL